MVTFCLPNGAFDFIAVDGELHQAQRNEVAFRLRGLFPPLPAAQYDVGTITRHLKQEINRALQLTPSILPQLVAVHAQYALPDLPRAVDFEKIVSLVTKFMAYHPDPARYHNAELAVYFALAYHSLYFVRLSRTSFVAVPFQAMAAVNKVMHSMTRVELDLGCRQLRTGTQSTLAKLLQDFLNHWALWNDQRLSRAVEAVLENYEGAKRSLDSPRAVSSALSQVGHIMLFPWADSVSEQSAQEVNTKILDKRRRSSSTRNASFEFTTNLLQESVLLDDSTAVRIDHGTHTLHIFIPYVRPLPSVLSKNSSIGAAARSSRLMNKTLNLLEKETIEKHCFQIGKKVPALRFSVRYDPKSRLWDESSARVDISEVLPLSLDLDSAAWQALSAVEPLVSDHELGLPESVKPDESSLSVVETSSDHTSRLAVAHAQAAAGRIAGIFMSQRGISAPFVATSHGREIIVDAAKAHRRLNSTAYVPVSRPFDSSLALIAQAQLVGRSIAPLRFGGDERLSLNEKLHELILPQLQLLTELERRDVQFWKLRTLQTQLESYATFHIFRCVLLEDSRADGSPQGQLIQAYCLDLGISVDVFVPPHTEQVFSGDQVIGTEILELDPLQGLFVVSM